MKILLIHCHYRLPGGEDAVFAAERALLEQHGHTVVVYERSNEEAAHGAAKALLPFRAVWNRRAARDVRNIIEQQHIDAVHIHNTLLLLSPAVVRAAKKCGVPVVLTLHNFRLFCPNGILLRDGRVCEDCPHHGLHCALRHRCYRGSLAQTLVVVAAYWLHRVLGTWRGITITTPTEFDREKLLEFNKIHPTFDENRLVVKPNPVTVPTGSVTPWEERKRQFVFAGRLEELKGLRTVIEAWRILGKDAPLLLVAGDGPLADWAKAQNLPKVQFVGQLPRDALHRLMAESRAVVAASLCYESFALVPAEAHALGTPVLASGIGNAWKMLGAVAGMTLAWLLDRRYIHFETQAVWWVQVIKVAVGMALLLAIKSGLKAPLLALLGHEGLAGGVRYFLLVLVAGAVWPLVFRPMSKWGKGKK